VELKPTEVQNNVIDLPIVVELIEAQNITLILPIVVEAIDRGTK
jgi:PII-like signaling protein